jgi:hypothetical protein
MRIHPSCIRHALIAASFLLAQHTALAQVANDSMPRAVADELIARTLTLVETTGLPPVDPEKYRASKEALRMDWRDDAEAVPRKEVYARLQALLNTLDADGHAMLWPKNVADAYSAKSGGEAVKSKLVAELIDAAQGKVLRFVPPQMTANADASRAAYVRNVLQGLADSKPNTACALIVDLTEQKGGNATPPLIVLQPLLTEHNNAKLVGRDGQRKPAITIPLLNYRARGIGVASLDNPLAQFAGKPIAVITSGNTVSAGEMLAVVLLGEGRRVRTFGWETAGKTTANVTHPMPDGASLLLSVSRYAIGEGDTIRGRIRPMQAAAPDGTLDDVLRAAAQWAASSSPACTVATATALKSE